MALGVPILSTLGYDDKRGITSCLLPNMPKPFQNDDIDFTGIWGSMVTGKYGPSVVKYISLFPKGTETKLY